MDVVSLMPTDLFYLIPAVEYNAIFRLPRLLKVTYYILIFLVILLIPDLKIYTLLFKKVQTYWEFFDRLDQVAKSGHVIR